MNGLECPPGYECAISQSPVIPEMAWMVTIFFVVLTIAITVGILGWKWLDSKR